MKAPSFFTSLTAVALSFAFLGSAEAQDSVHFKKEELAVGSRRVTKEGMTMKNKMRIEANGQVIQTLNQDMKTTKHIIHTILAMKGKKVTKVKVEVKAFKETLDQGEAGKNTKTNPMAGKNFILEKIKDVIAVTDENGNSVDESLVAEARKSFKDIFGNEKKGDFEELIPDRPVKIGETLKVTDELAQKLFDDSGDLKIDGFVMKLVAVKEIDGRKVGVFAISMNMSVKPAESMDMSMKMKGTLSLGADNTWPYTITMTGPLVFSGKQQGMDLVGKGSMTMSNSFRYSGPRASKKKAKAKAKLY